MSYFHLLARNMSDTPIPNDNTNTPAELTKRCARCGLHKPANHDNFFKSGEGFSTYCKPCHTEYTKLKKRERKAENDAKYLRLDTEKESLLHKVGSKYCDFDLFEPFDAAPRAPWLMVLAKKYEVELNPDGAPFQIGLMNDCTQTPGYTLTNAGSQTGKSRWHLIETIIMTTGRVPVSMRYDKGVDTGVPRKVTPENIARFGQLPDGSCGNIIGVGKYPIEKIPPKDSCPEVWIACIAEVKEKMWKKRLIELIPPECLDKTKGREGWSEKRQLFFIKGGLGSALIRLITYEQKYRKTEGDWAWMIILDEEPPDRKYFISATEHCTYLRLCFTPINGLGWSFYDCYLPATQGISKNVKIYSCTQYDSPYQKRERVDAKLNSYKPYEVKVRIFGQFAEMVGKPYYTYEITQSFLKAYTPRHTLARILPNEKPETVRDLLEIKIRLEPAENTGDDIWEIYEKRGESDAYFLSADVAQGNSDPGLAADCSVAYVRRLPRLADGEREPAMVAALQSRMRNVEFAWMCLYAACYYNLALVAPETGVSADGAVFVTTIAGYPFIYRHVTTNDRTNRLQEKYGFDTKSNSRQYAFDLVGSWIYSHVEASRIYHYPLLKEISECVVGKGGKPDHTERGSTDCILAYGISEYVYDLARPQIKCNKHVDMEDGSSNGGLRFPNIVSVNYSMRETRPLPFSSRGMDSRFGFRQPAERKF
jgi:phage terminase large subunit-like protein